MVIYQRYLPGIIDKGRGTGNSDVAIFSYNRAIYLIKKPKVYNAHAYTASHDSRRSLEKNKPRDFICADFRDVD